MLPNRSRSCHVAKLCVLQSNISRAATSSVPRPNHFVENIEMKSQILSGAIKHKPAVAVLQHLLVISSVTKPCSVGYNFVENKVVNETYFVWTNQSYKPALAYCYNTT